MSFSLMFMMSLKGDRSMGRYKCSLVFLGTEQLGYTIFTLPLNNEAYRGMPSRHHPPLGSPFGEPNKLTFQIVCNFLNSFSLACEIFFIHCWSAICILCSKDFDDFRIIAFCSWLALFE